MADSESPAPVPAFKLKSRHISDAKRFAAAIIRSRTKGADHLHAALRSLHVNQKIPLDDPKIKDIILSACDQGDIDSEDITLAYESVAEILAEPSIDDEYVETGLSDDDKTTLEFLAPYMGRIGANGKPKPIPFHNIFPKRYPDIEFYLDENTSQTRFDIITEWLGDRHRILNHTDVKNRIERMVQLAGTESTTQASAIAAAVYKIMRDKMRAKRMNEYGEVEYLKVDHIDSVTDLIQDASGQAISLIDCMPVDHRRDAPMRRRLAAKYDPDAKCPQFMAFLEYSSGYTHAKDDGDEKGMAIAKLWMHYQRFKAGYSLLKGNPLHRVFKELGPPGCGKTVLVETIMETMGDDFATAVNSESFIERKGGGRPPDPLTILSAMLWARMAGFSDLGDRGQLRAGMVKSLSGESKQQGRKLYHDAVAMVCNVTCWLQSNTPLSMGDDAMGIERRLRLTKWNHPVPEDMRDENLKAKLLTEMPGILNWMLEGLRLYHANGESCPQFVINDTNAYLNVGSPVIRLFINDQLSEEDEGQKIRLEKVYRRYRLWRIAEGKDSIDDPRPSKYMHTREQFRSQLEKNYIRIRMESGKNGRQYYIIGRKLNDDQLVDPVEERLWDEMIRDYHESMRNKAKPKRKDSDGGDDNPPTERLNPPSVQGDLKDDNEEEIPW